MMAKSYTYRFAFRILLYSLLFCLALGTSASPKYTLVEVWCVGDDALTTKLRDTLENAFKSSSDFRLSAGGKPGTLTVTIPSNVEWKLVGERTQVFYTVNFSSADNRHLGSSAGSCWEDSLSKCASKIIRDAKTAALKIH
jgi:sugar/nucleoside kinase (ribokinase family)